MSDKPKSDKPKNDKPKKRVTKKNSTPKKLPSILGTPMAHEYIRTNPVTEAFINNVCDKIIEFARSDEGFFVGSFLRKMNIPRRSFYNWLKTWPQLPEAVEEAKYYMGYGRMEGAMTRRLDKGAVLHSQYRFGEEWKKDDDHQATLRKSEENAIGNIKIVLPENEKVIDRKKFKPIDGKESEGEKQ
jgi:hypothetical protein